MKITSNKLNSAIVKPHSFFLRLLLALLLLGSQQMGLAHSIAHLGDGGPPGSISKLQSKQLPADKVCQQCLAFAQVDAAVDTAPCAFIAPQLEEGMWLASLAGSALPITRCAFQSRAPPTSL